MAKKNNGFFGMIADLFLKSTMANMKDGAEELLDSAHRKMLILQETMVQRLTMAVTLFLACLFFLAAAVFFLTEDIGMSNSQTFALLGLVLIVLTFFFKYRALQAAVQR